METVNALVSSKLKALSFVYESQGDRYRAMAYARAAKTVATYKDAITKLADVRELPGVGDSIGEKIVEIVATGTCALLKKFEAERNSVPASVEEMQAMKGVGPKTAIRLWKQYGVASMTELGNAIKDGKVTEPLVIEAFNEALVSVQRLPREDVVSAVAPLYDAIKAIEEVRNVEVAGSIRRGIPMVGDVDIVVCCTDANRPAVLAKLRELLTEPGQGKTKLAGQVLVKGLKRSVDISLTNEGSWGACLMYLTGSKEHNVMLRMFAKERGWLLNEYGLWYGEQKMAGATEAGIYEALGMSYLEPNEREGWVVRAKIESVRG